MISNPNGTTVLSSLGWVDKDAVWRFDAVSGRTDTVPLRTGAVDLRGRGGNPKLQLANRGGSIWASDYDTLVLIRGSPWNVVRSARLQGAFTGTQQFIGDFCLTHDEKICAVARPFSGDVVALDTATLKIKSSAQLGHQPLEVALLPAETVVARDWKTGDLLRGTLERRRWVRF